MPGPIKRVQNGVKAVQQVNKVVKEKTGHSLTTGQKAKVFVQGVKDERLATAYDDSAEEQADMDTSAPDVSGKASTQALQTQGYSKTGAQQVANFERTGEAPKGLTGADKHKWVNGQKPQQWVNGKIPE